MVFLFLNETYADSDVLTSLAVLRFYLLLGNLLAKCFHLSVLSKQSCNHTKSIDSIICKHALAASTSFLSVISRWKRWISACSRIHEYCDSNSHSHYFYLVCFSLEAGLLSHFVVSVLNGAKSGKQFQNEKTRRRDLESARESTTHTLLSWIQHLRSASPDW